MRDRDSAEGVVKFEEEEATSESPAVWRKHTSRTAVFRKELTQLHSSVGVQSVSGKPIHRKTSHDKSKK